jgi:hypothetical protein
MLEKYALNKMKQINHMLNELVEINVKGLSWVRINGNTNHLTLSKCVNAINKINKSTN